MSQIIKEYNFIEGLSSIVMCCYNGERFIHRSVSSILNQTYPYIELVFIDDGSTDGSLELIKSYVPIFESKGYVLTIHHQENQGLGYAAINGVEIAQGEFLSYLDVDDYLMPESIGMRVAVMVSNPDVNVVRTNAYKVQEEDINKNTLLVNSEYEKNVDDLFEALLLGNVNNYAGTYMVRAKAIRDFYAGHEIPRSRYGQNLQLLLPSAYKAKSLFIDKPLMKYIIQNGSHSNPPQLREKVRLIPEYMGIRFRMLELFEIENKTDLKIRIKDEFIRRILDIILAYDATGVDKIKERNDLYNEYYSELNRKDIKYRFYNAYINDLFSKHLFRICWAVNRIVTKNRK